MRLPNATHRPLPRPTLGLFRTGLCGAGLCWLGLLRIGFFAPGFFALGYFGLGFFRPGLLGLGPFGLGPLGLGFLGFGLLGLGSFALSGPDGGRPPVAPRDEPGSDAPARRWIASPAAALLLAALALSFVYTAWLVDDSYFTLRTVENFLAGHGLRWNVFERVQAYTHPLWMFLLSAAGALSGELYLTTLVTSVLVSLAAVLVLARGAATPASQVVALGLLLLSRAFVDFSTGGLENPLSHLVAALFLLVFVRPATLRTLGWLSALAALAALTRLDSILLYLPALAWRAFGLLRRGDEGGDVGIGAERSVRRSALAVSGTLALGFVPLLLWELFSCFYYGFPFPNTAYAKLGMGIPSDELLVQGLRYFADSLRRDALTLPVILLASGAALVRRGRDAVLALGILGYLAYVLRIGGDFMSGRFLALPFFLAVGLLAQRPLGARPWLPVAALLAVLASPFLHHAELLRSATPVEALVAHGIGDERRNYYEETGLLRPSGRGVPPTPLALPKDYAPGEVLYTNAGRLPYEAGPEVIGLDPYGLADPLLARLPARYAAGWLVGHYVRFTPNGYVKRLVDRSVPLKDTELQRFEETLRFVTSGPLFSWARLCTAWELNLGRHDRLVDREFYRYPLLRRGRLVRAEPGRWHGEGANERLAQEGGRFAAGAELEVTSIRIDFRGTALGSVRLLLGEEIVWREERPALVRPGRCELALDGRRATDLWIHAARGAADVHLLGVEVTVRER